MEIEVILNAMLCLSLFLAVYQTMMFIVQAVNSTIDGINDGEGFIDNRHYLLSWGLVLVIFFVKSIIL